MIKLLELLHCGMSFFFSFIEPMHDYLPDFVTTIACRIQSNEDLKIKMKPELKNGFDLSKGPEVIRGENTPVCT